MVAGRHTNNAGAPAQTEKIMKRKTTELQCAGLVASIGCPRRLEICNELGRRTLPAGQLRYRTEQQRAIENRAATAASGWVLA